MKKIFNIILGLFLIFGAAKKADAADRYYFDKVHTQILFFVDHLGFSKSQGEFLDYEGYFEFDPAKPQASKVQVTIKTASLDMDDTVWETKLLGSEFFKAKKFPNMVFTSTSIEVTGENTGKLKGNLTLLGKTNPVELDVIFNKAGIHPISKNYVAGFSATAQIKRSDFGMMYALPIVGDEVELRLEIEGIRQGHYNK